MYFIENAALYQIIFLLDSWFILTDPDKPYIDRIEAGVDSANISFVSSRKKPAENPGSQFHVEFIKEGM